MFILDRKDRAGVVPLSQSDRAILWRNRKLSRAILQRIQKALEITDIDRLSQLF